MDFWPASYTRRAILFALIITIGISFAFMKFIMPMGLFISGLFIIVFFFIGLNYYTIHWKKIVSQKVFDRKLFWHSFIFRLLAVAYMYLLTLGIDPDSFPMEPAAADSINYHNKAIILSNASFSEYPIVLSNLSKSRSDYGFSFYLSVFYKLFGPYTLPIRLMNCLLGSLTVVYLSRIARYIFSDKHARITGITAMLFPTLLWFNGIQLKETLMIFLFITTFYLTIKMFVTRKISFSCIIIALAFIMVLFYFRTFLAVLVIITLLFFFLINSSKKLRPSTIFLLIIFSFGSVALINQTGMFSEVYDVYGASEDVFTQQLTAEAKRVQNISYQKAAVTPFIIVGSLITPFPSFLVTEPRQLAIVAHYHNEIVRNLLYYFALIGIFIMYKKYRPQSTLILFFIISYLYVITTAGTSFQDRFHLPLVPFIIIAFSVGLIDSRPRWKYRWNYYILIIGAAEIVWTFFKLNIRGLS